MHRSRFLPVAVLLVSALAPGCTTESDPDLSIATGLNGDRSRQLFQEELEFRFIQTELAIAKTHNPYLVLDTEHKELAIKQSGTAVWNCPLRSFTEEDGGLEAFCEEFRGQGDRVFRQLIGKHLFEALDRTPDSLLVVVGRVVKVDPALLQRKVPERFQLTWEGGVTLEVRTEVEGEAVSRLQNLYHEIRNVLVRPFNRSIPVVMMDPDDALTLYRFSEEGIPTLIFPRAEQATRQEPPS